MNFVPTLHQKCSCHDSHWLPTDKFNGKFSILNLLDQQLLTRLTTPSLSHLILVFRSADFPGFTSLTHSQNCFLFPPHCPDFLILEFLSLGLGPFSVLHLLHSDFKYKLFTNDAKTYVFHPELQIPVAKSLQSISTWMFKRLFNSKTEFLVPKSASPPPSSNTYLVVTYILPATYTKRTLKSSLTLLLLSHIATQSANPNGSTFKIFPKSYHFSPSPWLLR